MKQLSDQLLVERVKNVLLVLSKRESWYLLSIASRVDLSIYTTRRILNYSLLPWGLVKKKWVKGERTIWSITPKGMEQIKIFHP